MKSLLYFLSLSFPKRSSWKSISKNYTLFYSFLFALHKKSLQDQSEVTTVILHFVRSKSHFVVIKTNFILS